LPGDRLGLLPFVEATAILTEPAAAVLAAGRAEVRDDLEVVGGDEVGDLAVALDDKGERRRLDTAEREDALMPCAARAHRLRPRGVNADEPVGALPCVRRVAQPVVLLCRFQIAEALLDSIACERRNPEA